ncbi:unnamed protein product [Durusdinium trenchii]|uniref:Uncharacterized protein n=1 Tax=Durusdinium trenchii TaxID=1381693 RepID=A0ABP0NMH0_9DINO
MRHCALPAALLAVVTGEGNPSCWQEGFSYSLCCGEQYGPNGNEECWDGMHTFKTCCISGDSFASSENFDDLMTRGSTGDASVLPAIMQLLSTGGEDCPSVAGQCEGAEGISGAQWKAFFEASSVSKFMRLQPFPPDGDPRELWSLCCANRTISVTEHAERLWPRCRAGAAALVMAVLPQLELRLGQESAMEGLEVAGRMAEQLEAEADCKWLYQTNRAAWSHFTWFLSEAKPGEQFLGEGDMFGWMGCTKNGGF